LLRFNEPSQTVLVAEMRGNRHGHGSRRWEYCAKKTRNMRHNQHFRNLTEMMVNDYPADAAETTTASRNIGCTRIFLARLASRRARKTRECNFK